MKKSRVFQLFVLVSIFLFALFFMTNDLGQAQSRGKGKPDKPGKPKPEPTPCNNNGICEWEEYDVSSRKPDNQPCPDCLPKIYAPLLIDQDYLQIASDGRTEGSYPYSDGKVFQFKCTGQNYIDEDIIGIYEDAWASEKIDTYGYGLVSIGDADNDGDKEIIAVGSRVKSRDEKIIFIYETGSGGLPNWTSPYFGKGSKGSIKDCIIADVDNDGENEVTVIKGRHIEIFRINYNSGDGSYSFNHVWTGPEYESMIFGLDVGDADNDGYNEIVLAMFEVGAPIIWKKVGETWSSKTAELIPEEYWNPNLYHPFLGIDVVKVKDADNVLNEFGERENEIIAGGNNNRLMIWKYNEVSGNYESVFISEDLLGFTQGVDAGDIDGDGSNEIAIAASYDDDTLYIFKYIDGNYIIVNSILRDGSDIAIGFSLGDLDGDGKAEIVSATQGITIYDLIGSDVFSGYLMKTYNCVFGSYLEID